MRFPWRQCGSAVPILAVTSVFLIPPSQPKLQTNCAKEYEQFFLDCPAGLTIVEAQQNNSQSQELERVQAIRTNTGVAISSTAIV